MMLAMITTWYGVRPSARARDSRSRPAATSADEEEELADLREVTEDAPIVKLANLIIRQGVQDRASDIHIEPTEHDLRIRYRIDGVLHEVMPMFNIIKLIK